ncbi:MAG TPA: hypothetical protein VNH18_15795 [Bryobacteraceae bacterium]|nr:hypothetical protein [Bryobacteraceae bacterium]
MMVATTKGLVDRSLLAVKDIVTEEQNARIIATEWYLDGELVRRDVWVSLLIGVEMSGEGGM